MPDGLTVCVVVPGLKTVSLNVREHWSARAKRCREQKAAALLALAAVSHHRQVFAAATRIHVRLVRLGGRKLDRDNLAGALKPILDAVGQWTGIDDGDEARMGLEWGQEPGGSYGVRIEITVAGAMGAVA